MPSKAPPLTVALIDDYDVVVAGVAHMFDRYPDRIAVVEADLTVPLRQRVDIALYDAFAQPTADHAEFARLTHGNRAGRVVVYTWNFHGDLVDAALANGAAGYLSKALPAGQLVDALERIHRGEQVVSPAPRPGRLTVGLDWPGRSEGLSERESEVLALIVQGHSNAQVCDQLCLSLNTIKTYVRSAYRKIGADNRVQAVLWGIDHGFKPDHHRITDWLGEPAGDSSIRGLAREGGSVR